MNIINETWEVLKPVPINHGYNKPFISINRRDKIYLNKAARQLLGLEQGGYAEILKHKEKSKIFIVPRKRKTSTTFIIPKSGKISDLMLHERLRDLYDLNKDKLCRLYIEADTEKYEHEEAYCLNKG